MGFIRKQLLKVIEWNDNTTDTIVYRYPNTDRKEIMNGCQLVVRPSQVAILVSSGKVADVYTEGTHKLTTGNMPILTTLMGWKYGFDSPFKAEVYYVNTKQFVNQKWGTATKITLRDQDFGLVRVGARGVYSYKVEDVVTFMKEIFGTNKDYSTSSLAEYFKSIVVSGFSDAFGEAKIPVLDISAKYREISDIIKQELSEDFKKIGIELVNFVLENVSLPEEVEKAIDQRSSLGALKGNLNEFTQYQTAQAIKDAANNPNGGVAGAGVGIGAGFMMGNTMINSINQGQANTNTNNNVLKCNKCGNQLLDGAKFCSECGSPVQVNKFCSNCGNKVTSDSKFCPNCGKSL